jgi:hypothetical protein
MLFVMNIFLVIFVFIIGSFNIFLGYVCFPEFTFQKTTFQTFMYLFDIRKVG